MSVYTSAAVWSATTHISIVASMLLRNIIFARILSPTDFAIALTFGVVLSLFEYISNFGHENLMQRSNQGNQPTFQATMQSMMIARGALVAMAIVLISPFVPSLLNLENIEFNYAWLAVVPLINGFAHLDHQRLHRRQIYIVSTKIGLIADISSIFVALACVLIWENYWAFYVSFVFRHSASTMLSHFHARRSYTLALDKQHIKTLIRFGAPLLLVGALKYIGIEFDKAIIARTTGLETFAIYVLTLMLVVNATNIVSVALSKIFIRRVSTAGQNISAIVSSNGIIYCFLVLPLLVILCVLGEDLITLIFGRQYHRVPFLITAICAVAGIRSLNQWLNQTVIASAPTKLMLYADIVRVCSALLCVWIVYESYDVIKIAMSFWFAEIAYFATLTLLLHKRFPIAKTSSYVFSMYFVCLAGIYVLYIFSYESSLIVKLLFTASVVVLLYSVFLTVSMTCRNQTAALLKPLVTKIGL